MFKNKLNYKLVNTILVMIIIYLLYLTSDKWGFFIGKVIQVALPFLGAFIFAYVLHPFVKKLEAKGVRKKLAVTMVATVVAILFIGLIWITLPLVYDQLVLFSKTVIEFITDISNKFDLNLGGFSDAINDSLNNIIKNVGAYVSDGTIDFVSKGINIVTNIIIIFIVGIYFLNDMDKIKNKVKKYLKRIGKKEYLYVQKLDHEMSNYFHGLAIFMLIQLFEYSILFKIAGHPNWLLLGVLACVTTIIPYFGGYITNIIAIITASVISSKVLIATIIICLIFPNVDGYLISPRIYGKTNNVNPVMVIFAVALGGSLFGFLGIVAALPIYILIKASIDYYEEDIKKGLSNIKDAIDD